VPIPAAPTWVPNTAEDAGALAGEVEALAAAATAADGTAPLSEQVLRSLRRPHAAGVDGAEHLVARTRDGALVGYAQLDATATTPDGAPDPVAELVVHPAHRRVGVGAALLAALLDRAGDDPATTRPPRVASGAVALPRIRSLRVWAHGAHPAAAALAARFGLVAERELWRMRRSLVEPLDPPHLPDGVTLRPFRVGADEAELLRVNNAAFSWHPEQGGWTAADVAVREAEPWFDAAGLLLAVDPADPARVLGFHWTKVHPAGPDGSGPIGEVYVLAVDPAARGRGLGPALTQAGLAHLRDLGVDGLDAVLLYVEADNAAAVRLYRHLGFTLWGRDVSYRHR
jgi:mycothiol synthase